MADSDAPVYKSSITLHDQSLLDVRPRHQDEALQAFLAEAKRECPTYDVSDVAVESISLDVGRSATFVFVGKLVDRPLDNGDSHE
jgi:hypothetical protein